MTILLVGPRADEDLYANVFDDIPYISGRNKGRRGAIFAPLALVTVAALTPPEHEVQIHDEQVHGPVEDRLARERFDVLGISMLANQANRTTAIARFCRAHFPAMKIVVGGAGTSTLPEGLDEFIDVVFFGEAEEGWADAVRDLAKGCARHVYQCVAKPDMALSPIPRWDLLKDVMPLYGAGVLQTSRGCPFDCVFCSVVYIYGRRLRSKPVAQVLAEFRLLLDMGAVSVLIADDNFAADKRYAKEVLRGLIELNQACEIPLGFVTQTDISIADDDELLELFADANFMEVLIGIEAVTDASMRTLDKTANLRTDVRQAIAKIQSYGIPILASLVIGSDSDDRATFQKTLDFIEETGIVDHNCHPLMAPPGTRLWYQLKREGRLVGLNRADCDRLDILTNIVPARMTRVELMQGLADYWERACDPQHFAQRLVRFVRGVKRRPAVKAAPWRALWRYRRMMFLALWYFCFQVTPVHRKTFFTVMRATRRHAPFLLQKVMFLHTTLIASCKRAAIASRLAREQAAWEATHPESVTRLDPALPIPAALRDRGTEIVAAAYERIRSRRGDRETVHRATVGALRDYVDRYGTQLAGFDDSQRRLLHESCDRVLATLPADPPGHDSDLPKDRPPPGFAREILDVLDLRIRARARMATPAAPPGLV